jgi:hypothetical protein
MSRTKYGHYVVTEFSKIPEDAIEDVKYIPMLYVNGDEKFGGSNFSIVVSTIDKPATMVPEGHSHDFDQYLCFVGLDPKTKDLGGEAEIYLGEEKEKHVINTSAIIHIPKGLMHCPLIHKRIDRPYLFMDIYLSPSYERDVSDKP